MGRLLLVVHLPTVGGKAREELLSRMASAAKYVSEHEPETFKYAMCVPRDESDQKSVYAIEEYANTAAFDLHRASKASKDAFEFITQTDVPVLEGQPIVRQLEVFDEMASVKSQLNDQKDPYIVVGQLTYRPNTMSESIQYWQAVAATSKDEPGTLAYILAKDAIAKDDGDRAADKLFTVEAYESKDYLWNVHAKSQAVADNVANTSHLREGLKHTFLKLHSGFLYK